SRLLKIPQDMAVRPGPLMPYPLDMFKADTGVPGMPAEQVPKKRPYAPGSGRLDSPAKRRMKAEGGSLCIKSPLSVSSNRAGSASTHFDASLRGRDSPAKKLDFGAPRSRVDHLPSSISDLMTCGSVNSPSTPRRSSRRIVVNRVRRSPRLSARSIDLGGPAGGQQPRLANHVLPITKAMTASEYVSSRRVVTPPDPQSIHYPGFDIYQDPFVVPPTSLVHCCSVANEEKEDSSDNEHDKENRPPRRKAAKTAAPTTADTSLIKAALLSPPSARRGSERTEKTRPIPASPHPKHVCDYLSLSRNNTPKERVPHTMASPAHDLIRFTPGRTPLGKEERRQMRRALEEEVDDFAGDDDP
ncbi:hypothetical protein BD414DRAFT_406572, partial [Trametes punicea]